MPASSSHDLAEAEAIEEHGQIDSIITGEAGEAAGQSSKKRVLDEDPEPKPSDKHARKKTKDVAGEETQDDNMDEAEAADVAVEAKPEDAAPAKVQDEVIPDRPEDKSDPISVDERPATPPQVAGAASTEDDVNRDMMTSPSNKRRHESIAEEEQAEPAETAEPTEVSGVQTPLTQEQLERAAKRQKSQSPQPKEPAAAAIDNSTKTAASTTNVSCLEGSNLSFMH